MNLEMYHLAAPSNYLRIWDLDQTAVVHCRDNKPGGQVRMTRHHGLDRVAKRLTDCEKVLLLLGSQNIVGEHVVDVGAECLVGKRRALLMRQDGQRLVRR